MSLSLKCLSLIHWLYHSSTFSCIQRHIHRASCSSANLHPLVRSSIKTHPMRLLYYKHIPILSNALNSVSLSFTVFIIFRVFDFIVLFYTSFKTFLMVYFFSIFFSIFMSFSISLAMSSHRHQREMTPLGSPEPIQGITL